MPSDLAPSPGASSNTNHRRLSTRLKRGLFIVGSALLGFILLLFIITGPAFSSVTRWAGLKAAGIQGISGDFTIEGTLFSGFTIREIELTGEDSPLVSLSLESVELDYDFFNIISAAGELNWLNLLSIKNAVIELNIPVTDESTAAKTKKKRAQETYVDFNPAWNLLNSDIEIENISVVAQIEEERYELGSFSLKTPIGREGSLSIHSIRLPGKEPISPLSARLQHEDKSLTLDRFSGKKIESLKHLTLREESPGEWVIDAGFEAGGGQVSVFADTTGLATLKLRSGQTIDLAQLPSSPKAPKLKGIISDFDLRFKGDFASPASWQLQGKVLGHGLAADTIGVDSLAVILSGNQIKLDMIAPGARLSGVVSAPLESLTSTDDFATMPVDLAADLKLESLEKLLRAWDIELPLSGAIDGRIENVQLVGGTSLRSGSVLFLSDSLQLNGEALSHLQLAAQVPETDQIKLVAEAGLDESTKVQFNGDFQLESMSYRGTLDGKFDTGGLLGGVLERLKVTDLAGAGNLNWEGTGTIKPVRHLGEARLTARDLTFQQGHPIEALIEASYEDDRVMIPTIRIESNPVSLTGKAAWQDQRITVDDLNLSLNDARALTLTASLPFDPASGEEFLKQEGDIAVSLIASELEIEELALLFTAESPITGRLNGQLDTSGRWDALSSQGEFSFRPGANSADGDPSLNLDMKMSGDVARPESWEADLGAILSGLKWDEIQFGDLNFRAATRLIEGRKSFDAAIHANQEGASLTANTRLDLSGADSLKALEERAFDLSAKLNAPDLAPLWQQLAPPAWRNLTVAGQLSLDLSKAQFKGREVLSGDLALFSDTLSIDGERLERIDLSAQVRETNAITATLALYADELSRVDGRGAFHLTDQIFDADMDLALDLDGAGVLKRLVGDREIARLLPGTAALSLNAAGNIKKKTTSGEFDLEGQRLILADKAAPIDSFKLAGTFSESSLATLLALRSDPLDLDGEVNWDGDRVDLTKLTASTGGTPVFTATASAPLSKDKLTAADWLSQEGPLELRLNSDPIALKTLMQLVKDAPPVNGDLDLDLTINGSPAQPNIDLALAVSNIALPEQYDVKVGSLDLELKASDAEAHFEGSYRHPDVNPLIINAALPFFPKEWALGSRKFVEEKISASAQIKSSPLGFLSSQVPAIKSIEGDIALDAALSGTLSAPLISGDGILDVSRLRLDNRDAPSFYDINLKTRFAKNRLTIETLHAIVAGGEVDAAGTIHFIPDNEPKLDLRLGAKEALVFRTPDLSLRTDASLTLTGPWSAATLAGSIGITNSRFFKNFDLLPQTLPTRNTSVLPTVERSPAGGGAAYTDLNLGVDIPPFNNWNADVRLHTQDPFQVRSNLVESDLVADIHVSGKLSSPSPVGFLAIDEGELSLPFSSIDVETGRVEFDRETGFNGAINLKAQAKADKYRINVYLYNRILDPKYVLTSNPPLPSEDLMTLLVTGTTRDALTGGDVGSLAASKAATLLFKNMRKASNKADTEPSLLDTLQERTELDIGGINPETGVQTVGGKIRLWKQLFFVGDVDAENDYRALLKYVFRFR
ncbi:MAG: translocation/assembly module TamB domain-containing protein [Verrucomicrobiales bacterium]|nr:translocation/assembly module TamB domain-containing protein [Verrucomicrobiales bacterium]